MARLCFILLLVLAVCHTTNARDVPNAKGLNDQKNFVTFGGVGSYSGIGNNGLPTGGIGGGVGAAGDIGGINGIGGIGGGAVGGLGGGAGGLGTLGGGVGGGAGGGTGFVPFP